MTHPLHPTPLPLRYTFVAKLFHWLMALMLATLFGVGLYMADLPFSPLRLKLYNWHKWAGVCALLLVLLRLVWRLTHQPPPLPQKVLARMPQWQRVLHHATHGGMYALMLVVPLVGWAYSCAAGFPVVLFGVLPLPQWVATDAAVAELIKPWHEISAFALAGLVGLHVLAALKHHFIDRDGLLARMGWSRS